MDNAISISALRKTYAPSKKSPAKDALKGIDLNIPRGSMFALLGPNGAGKSTLINIMAGLVHKTSGTVTVWGNDLDTDARNARAAIGVVPQEITFDPFFTPRRTLELQAGLYGVPSSERWTSDLLEMVGLLDKADSPARSLSGGMRRRLMVAKAMVHRPPVLILDEPSAGVDVELRHSMWENVRALNRAGTTVLLTTHYLEEAEQLCGRIAIINNGQIVANDLKENLLATVSNKEARLRLDQDITAIPADLSPWSPQLEGQRTILLRYAPEHDPFEKILAVVRASGLTIRDITTQKSDLEDVFLDLTRKKAA
jgi:ABC-2 type transport system ATP-binding protein